MPRRGMISVAPDAFGFGAGVRSPGGAFPVGVANDRGEPPEDPGTALADPPVAFRGSLCETPGTRCGNTAGPVEIVVGVA